MLIKNYLIFFLFLLCVPILIFSSPNLSYDRYVCSADALHCRAIDLQVQAGIAPIVWSHKGEVTSGSFVFFSPESSILQVFNGPKFSTLFHIPWTIGGQLGYALSENLRIYIETNYVQAQGKNAVAVMSLTTPSISLTLELEKFHLIDAYAGARYYWNRWCNHVSFFAGAKLGLIHHNNTRLTFTMGLPQLPTGVLQLLEKSTSVSGGINAGLDICFCNNWAFVLTVEMVICPSPKINNSILLNPSVGTFTSLSFGTISTEFRFPITAGIRYSF